MANILIMFFFLFENIFFNIKNKTKRIRKVFVIFIVPFVFLNKKEFEKTVTCPIFVLRSFMRKCGQFKKKTRNIHFFGLVNWKIFFLKEGQISCIHCSLVSADGLVVCVIVFPLFCLPFVQSICFAYIHSSIFFFCDLVTWYHAIQESGSRSQSRGGRPQVSSSAKPFVKASVDGIPPGAFPVKSCQESYASSIGPGP